MNTFTTSLSPQNDDIIFNLQSSDLNFDPVINFGRVKGSFVDKFMRLADSSMATTYNYNHNPQLNANEQDITDISFWRGLIGQMIIPELDPNLLTTFRALQAANPNFLRNMSKNGTIPLFYFPFHTPDNANPNTPGETGWEEYWQRILKHKYLSRACKEQTGSDFESSVRNCLIDEAALRQATFVFPIKNDVINISFNGYGDRLGGCVDISDNRRNVACPNRDFGGLFDHIQPDYYNMEQQVKDAIKKGKSVLLRKKCKDRKENSCRCESSEWVI